MKKIRCFVEAMRLRTLPVSVAGVILATGYALLLGRFKPVPAVICLVFAILAQIASNFANEYYDYTAGRDRAGREGPRRGVTEGDISPSAMKKATYATLLMAGCVGLSLVAWGGWWLVFVGIFIGLAALAYSTGPFPLSAHGLGEVAVVFFFGIIPVNLTYYVQALEFDWLVAVGSLSAGLLGADVLIVNNYRDCDDDRAVAKNTLAVKWGRRCVRHLYLVNALVAIIVMLPVWDRLPGTFMAAPAFCTWAYICVWRALGRRTGRALNPLLGITACLMLLYCALFLAGAAID